MNKDVKEKWLAALRSGEYVQGRNRLTKVYESGSEHCCLGVLCDLAVKAEVTTSYTSTATMDGGKVVMYGQDGDTAFLPEEVMLWAEIEERNPVIGVVTLSHMNDDLNYDFNQIAKMVEAAL